MENIIYFGNDWFAENKTSSHHISERLALDHRVLYIECPGLRSPNSSSRDVRKLFSKLIKSISGPRKIHDQLYVYTLLQLPYHKYSAIRFLNSILAQLTIAILIATKKMKSPVLWFVVPHLYMMPGKFRSNCSVYYCIDDYAGLPGVDIKAVEEMDKHMSKRSDVIFLASDTLEDSKKQLNKNVHVSPHGVDFEHFNQVYLKSVQPSPDMKDIQSPVIGCFGLIDDRIDLKLVSAIAKRHPDWQFVFIGRLDVDDNPCDGLDNIRFLGCRDYQDLPKYAVKFDVTIMPYKPDHRMNINCNPLKLREYLSTGLPVVSTRLPQVEKYSDYISIADNDDEFENMLEHCIKGDMNEPALVAARLDSVKDFTWDARVKTVWSIVQRMIAGV